MFQTAPICLPKNKPGIQSSVAEQPQISTLYLHASQVVLLLFVLSLSSCSQRQPGNHWIGPLAGVSHHIGVISVGANLQVTKILCDMPGKAGVDFPQRPVAEPFHREIGGGHIHR